MEKIQIRTELASKMETNEPVSEEILQLMGKHGSIEILGEITQLTTLELLELNEKFMDEMERKKGN